ncbi:response regulator [Lichenicoccus roseus]|uniref:Response regulator n=2 Tax=Lichenicoccus roseus TaxID=2683649 RepID=A0A5R9JAK5_9PROT|nr:response regulator [Lichenicoccus roseus]
MTPTNQSVATRILVVDDSRVVRKVARRILEEAGYDVAEAGDGAQALAQCHVTLPDVVLLDWNMPVMNGIDCLRGLRRDFGPDEPSVILCTTENGADFIVSAIEAGAQEYIMKPFDDAILIGKLEQLGLTGRRQ